MFDLSTTIVYSKHLSIYFIIAYKGDKELFDEFVKANKEIVFSEFFMTKVWILYIKWLKNLSLIIIIFPFFKIFIRVKFLKFPPLWILFRRLCYILCFSLCSLSINGFGCWMRTFPLKASMTSTLRNIH